MKLYQLIAASAMAVLALAGCNKNEAEAPEKSDPDAGLKEVTISISGVSTKSQIDTPSAGWTTDIAEIDEFDIYFTSVSGAIGYVYEISGSSEYIDAYDELKKGGSVRFIGLENVSGVYVVANSESTLSAGDNISTLFADEKALNLENYNSEKAKKDILYVGGDIDLTPIVSEPVSGVDINIPSDGDMASQSYTATVYLRPVISRIEIGDVYVEASGEHTMTVGEGDDAKTYKYTWTGFTPKLIGIYMSNVAGTLDPIAHSVDEWFAKPTGTQVTAGKWNDEITYVGGSPFDMSKSGMNLEKVLWYSNYTSAYGDLFASGLASNDGNNHYYFRGATASPATCVPFNFFVPFDVTAATNTTEATAIWTGAEDLPNGNNPALHFQFDFYDKGEAENAYSYQVFDVTGGEPGTEITKDNNPDLWFQLTSRINFNTVSENIYYANVTSFNEVKNVAPNTIYKLTEVGINPFNLTTGTETVEEDYNIIVKVTTVPYIIKNVTPSFDNE